MDAFAWAHEHFWHADLPDLRLKRRLVDTAACIRHTPSGTLSGSIEDKAAVKGANRLFNHPEVTHERILQPHLDTTRTRCAHPGEYLLIEDTTALSFSQRAALEGMGPLTGELSQGMLVHTCLAAHVEHWEEGIRPQVTLAGVFGQECWARNTPQGTRAERKQASRKQPRTQLESSRWGRALHECASVPQGAQWTLVADAECDIFDVMLQCAGMAGDWIIRAAQPRKTLPDNQSVLDTVAQAPVLDTHVLSLRARPGAAARTATVEVRACASTIGPPCGARPQPCPVTCGLVEVRETDPPANAKPLHWLLLTSWPCATAHEARRVVETYRCRWLIEEYHKALKTGTKIEETQLTTANAITAKLAIHTVVAYELLQLKLLARSRPGEPVDEDLLPPASLIVLEKKYGRPAEGWTWHTVLITIATMGGYLGRKNDGPPGWQTIWRGYFKLLMMTEGYLLFTQDESYG